MQCDIPHSPELNRVFFIICTHIFEFCDHKQNSNKTPIRTQAISQGPITGPDPIFP